MIYFGFYILIINLVAVIMCVADKQKAKSRRYRIKEKSLFMVSILGGSVGMFFAMQISRHKTKHLKFMLGIPLIFLIQLVIVTLVFQNFKFG